MILFFNLSYYFHQLDRIEFVIRLSIDYKYFDMALFRNYANTKLGLI